MQTVTKVFRASYSHTLPRYQGKCGQLHGHNARIEVTFRTPIDYLAYPGIVLDFKDIKAYVEPIVNKFIDHQDLNGRDKSGFILKDPEAIKAFEVMTEAGERFWSTTAENIAKFLAIKILKTPVGDGLVHIRIWETDDSYTDLFVEENQ